MNHAQIILRYLSILPCKESLKGVSNNIYWHVRISLSCSTHFSNIILIGFRGLIGVSSFNSVLKFLNKMSNASYSGIPELSIDKSHRCLIYERKCLKAVLAHSLSWPGGIIGSPPRWHGIPPDSRRGIPHYLCKSFKLHLCIRQNQFNR